MTVWFFTIFYFGDEDGANLPGDESHNALPRTRILGQGIRLLLGVVNAFVVGGRFL